ncbi:MAG: ArsB/NhaD family transporter [Phycisphaerae bacterium]|nr:ArsB/NhaD family transporter [Phycisphaerae bacterium]
MSAIISIAIFVTAYLLIASDKVNKTIVAVLGASLILLLRIITFDRAVAAIDLNVIFLLVGMMTSVSILAKTGFFEWAAISTAKLAKGKPIAIMLLLLTVTAFFSAFLDNVTCIVLFVPVTILITQILEISPVPFVILEAIASNIGGTATLIGDPPNIIIGSQGNLSFNDFLVNLSPAILVTMAIFLATVYFLYRKHLVVSESIRRRIDEAIPRLAIIDKKNMIKSLIVMAMMMLGFFLHAVIGLEPGIIALAGSMVMMLVCKAESNDSLMRVEWAVIFFFIGLFIMVAALEETGAIDWIAHHLLAVAGHNLFLMCIVVLWSSAILSALLDNIPFVIAMVPLLKLSFTTIAQNMGIVDPIVIQHSIAEPLWWSLALGVCLGGNGTLIGASANVVAAQICDKNKYHISFWEFTKIGFPLMIQSAIVSTIYIWLRFFRP